MATLLDLVAPHTAGDPMNEHRWLNCRLRDIQERLPAVAHVVSLPVISRLLRASGYRLRLNQKQLSASQHPDRDRQFRHILDQRREHLEAGEPVISVDTKKKELIGDFKNGGRVWCRTPELVNVHDFPTDGLGRAVPYGIYDLMRNSAVVYVGQSADTAEFAVSNIARWCATELRLHYPRAKRLLIEADAGGSNSARARLWKTELQEQVADRFGLAVTVCHYPSGASKWNPIEHRVFSEISKTWAGCPLRSFALVLEYLRQTTTVSGLQVAAELVSTVYATGRKVTDEIMALLNITAHEICPSWSYTIRPRSSPLPAATG